MKKRNRFKRDKPKLSKDEHRRRKREVMIIFIVIFAIVFLTFAENRIIPFGGDLPISNMILMFILININLLLLLLLIFLVFRNLVKLLYDRKRKVMGSKLRTRLVIAFVGMTLLPTIILFFFSINVITSSMEFWFKVPVEQALDHSLQVGRRLYQYIDDHHRFFLERISYQVHVKKLTEDKKQEALSNYIRIVQREFNLQSVEVYTLKQGRPVRAGFALDTTIEKWTFPRISPEDLAKALSPGNVHSISETISIGEVRRSIGTIPFGIQLPGNADVDDKQNQIKGFVVLSVLIPQDLSEDMSFISNGYEVYQQVKMVKGHIRVAYYMIISIVALLVLFCAIWFGFYLAKTISVPIKDLAEGTRRVAEGDLSFTIDVVADDEMGFLVESFNRMTRDLRFGREQLELSTHKLKDQNVEIEEKRRYMEIVLKNVSTGVITLDAGGFVTTTNKSAEKMLNIRSEDILHKSYKALLKDQHLHLAKEVMENLTMSRDGSVEFPLKLAIDGSPRSFMVRVNALKDETARHVGMVMVFDDLTELEKAQRMAAWREIARRIAHEVKNPLTPIKLSAQRLERKYSSRLDEPVFEECTRMIIDHVDLIRNLVNEFSNFARFPAANPVPCDLLPIIEETISLFREGHRNICFDIFAPETGPARLSLDRQQIKQAMINLVNNAIAAIKGKGKIGIHIFLDPLAGLVRIEVADDGPGISDEEKTRLFEPYFSTKKKGMGLGLSIVNSIVAEHNGKIDVQDNTPSGARFIIELPVLKEL